MERLLDFDCTLSLALRSAQHSWDKLNPFADASEQAEPMPLPAHCTQAASPKELPVLDFRMGFSDPTLLALAEAARRTAASPVGNFVWNALPVKRAALVMGGTLAAAGLAAMAVQRWAADAATASDETGPKPKTGLNEPAQGDAQADESPAPSAEACRQILEEVHERIQYDAAALKREWRNAPDLAQRDIHAIRQCLTHDDLSEDELALLEWLDEAQLELGGALTDSAGALIRNKPALASAAASAFPAEWDAKALRYVLAHMRGNRYEQVKAIAAGTMEEDDPLRLTQLDSIDLDLDDVDPATPGYAELRKLAAEYRAQVEKPMSLLNLYGARIREILQAIEEEGGDASSAFLNRMIRNGDVMETLLTPTLDAAAVDASRKMNMSLSDDEKTLLAMYRHAAKNHEERNGNILMQDVAISYDHLPLVEFGVDAPAQWDRAALKNAFDALRGTT